MNMVERVAMPLVGMVVAIVIGVLFVNFGVDAWWNWSDFAATNEADLGISIPRRAPVSDLIEVRQYVTVELLTLTLIGTMLLAPLMAYIGTIRDSNLKIKFFGGNYAAMPIFWLGLILILYFGVTENIDFMRGGICDIRANRNTPCGSIPIWQRAEYLFAPVLVLVTAQLGRVWLRIRDDGTMPIPLTIAQAGLDTGFLISNIILIETIFSLPGLGRLMVGALAQRDLPVLYNVLPRLIVMAVIIHTVFHIIHNLMTAREGESLEKVKRDKTATDDKPKHDKPFSVITEVKQVAKRPSVIAALTVIGLTVIVLPVIATILSLDPRPENLSYTYGSPNADYWLGTDDKGRNFLARLIFGASTSMQVGLIASLVGTTLAATIGWVISRAPNIVGYVRGIVSPLAFGATGIGVLLYALSNLRLESGMLPLALGLFVSLSIVAWWLRNPPQQRDVVPVVMGLFFFGVAEALLLEVMLSYLRVVRY